MRRAAISLARAISFGTVGAPSGCGAERDDEAALLVEPQGLGGNAEPFGGFGRVQELGGRAHESPHRWLTAILIEAASRPRSSRRFAVFSYSSTAEVGLSVYVSWHTTSVRCSARGSSGCRLADAVGDSFARTPGRVTGAALFQRDVDALLKSAAHICATSPSCWQRRRKSSKLPSSKFRVWVTMDGGSRGFDATLTNRENHQEETMLAPCQHVRWE